MKTAFFSFICFAILCKNEPKIDYTFKQRREITRNTEDSVPHEFANDSLQDNGKIEHSIVVNNDTIALEITPDKIVISSIDREINTYYYKNVSAVPFPMESEKDEDKSVIAGKTWRAIGPFYCLSDTIGEIYGNPRDHKTQGELFYELYALKEIVLDVSYVEKYKRIIIPVFFRKEIGHLSKPRPSFYQDYLLFENLNFMDDITPIYIIIDLKNKNPIQLCTGKH